MLTAIPVILVLVLLIVVHEFGHFIAAKLFRVKVEEFGIGYPPRAFTLGKLGDTVYTINWLPLGGFVRLYGDEGEGQHGRGSLVESPRWKQGIILLAGVAMNAVAAWVLFTVALHIGIPKIVDAAPAGQHTQLLIADIVPGSPAAAVGLKPGDELMGIRDQNGVELATLTPDSVVNFVSTRGGKAMTLTYREDGKEKTATAIPANAVIPGAEGRPGLGIALALVAVQSESWSAAAVDAFYETGRGFANVAGSLWGIVSSALHGAPNLSDVAGPVGIVTYAVGAAQNGISSVLFLVALISINLVIINLIPIPALDGGRLFVLIIEGITRRNVPRLLIQTLNAIGVSIIVLFMVLVTYHDIVKQLI